MVQSSNTSKKDSAEVKAAKALKAKKSEEAKAKKAAKKAATKAAAELSLEEHEKTQTAKDDELEQEAIDPMQRQMMEMRQLIGLISCKQSELEAKVGGISTKIHALQMRHVATPMAPIDVDDDAELDPETFSPDAKDNIRLLDSALMTNYKAKNSNLRVWQFCFDTMRHFLQNFRLRWPTLSQRLSFVHHRACM